MRQSRPNGRQTNSAATTPSRCSKLSILRYRPVPLRRHRLPVDYMRSSCEDRTILPTDRKPTPPVKPFYPDCTSFSKGTRTVGRFTIVERHRFAAIQSCGSLITLALRCTPLYPSVANTYRGYGETRHCATSYAYCISVKFETLPPAGNSTGYLDRHYGRIRDPSAQTGCRVAVV